MLELSLSISNVFTLISEVGVLTEVWYEIINWMARLMGGWRPGQKRFSLSFFAGLHEPVLLWEIPGAVNSLLLFQMGERILNIAIKSKVWHEIILIVALSGLGPIPFMT